MRITRLPRLNASIFQGVERERFETMQNQPIRILQIGEGNFLRGFFDWMIHECRKQSLYDGKIAVTQPRLSGSQNISKINQQDGLYTLLVRGQEQGNLVEHREIISVIGAAINPYEQWSEFLSLAENPQLEVVVSNTTEAGLIYEHVPFNDTEPLASFPAKLTLFLYRRFLRFGGKADMGLLILPCELVERNGELLLEYVTQHAVDWELPEGFIPWVQNHNRFLNSLVDRIVTGFPSDEAERLFDAWGYKDSLLTTAEPYYFWAIQAEPELESKLPFNKAGLNVKWVPNLAPFQLRKVRILNGAHTLMAVMGLLREFQHVRQVAEDTELGAEIRRAIATEIVPSLPLNADDADSYAKTVWDRFCNPFIEHRLSDIAMNSVSKFRVRLLPTLTAYLEKTGELPVCIAQCFAELIRLYRVQRIEEAGKVIYKSYGSDIVLRDNVDILETFRSEWSAYEQGQISLRQLVQRILCNTQLWGLDLLLVEGLAELLENHLAKLEETL